MYDKTAWKYYARFYRGKLGKVLAVFGLSILQSLTVFPIVFLAKQTVDTVIPESDTKKLIEIGATILVLVLIGGALGYATRRIALLVNSTIIKDLRFDLIGRYYALPLASIIKVDKGKFHTVFLADVGRIESMGNMFISSFLPSAFATFLLTGVLLYLNWILFLVLIVLFPLLVYITQKMGIGIKNSVDAYRKSFQDLSKRMFFVLWMSELTRIQTAEDYESDRQGKGLAEYQERTIRMSLQQSAYGIVQKGLTAFIGVTVLIVGGIAVSSDAMSMGELLSFYLAARLLQGYANPLLSAVPTVISGNEALREISEVIGLEDRNPYLGTGEVDFEGTVSLRNVTFGYDRNVVLKNASMELNSGETVAVLGPNGAGKSTITNLILGFYRPLEGEVFAEERSYTDISLANLRKRIGVVPQTPNFFKGTIFENIVYGMPEVTQAEVEDASRRAGSHDFIAKLPEGYETSLADAGALISGGERQLIAICRALLRSPKLLILDEPTNHLSKEAVRKLLESLKRERKLRTTLIISHQWEVASDADKIYYLEDGSLKRVGLSELPSLEDKLSDQNRD